MSQADPVKVDLSSRSLSRRCWAFIGRWVWRLTKSLALVLLLAILGGTGWIVFMNHRGNLAAADIAALIVQRGQSVPEPIDENDPENGARFYLAASKLLVFDDTFYDTAPIFGMAEWPLFGDKIMPKQAELLSKIATPNQAAFDLFREARKYELFAYGFNSSSILPDQTSQLGELRRNARWMGFRVYLASAEQQPIEVIELLLDLLALNNSIPDYSTVLAHLVRTSIESLAIGTIEDTLSRMTFSEEALTTLAKNYRVRPADEILSAALKTEATLIAEHMTYPDIYVAEQQYQDATIFKVMEQWSDFPFQDFETPSWWHIASWRAKQTYLVLCPGHTQIQNANAVRFQFEVADKVRRGDSLGEDFITKANESGIDYAEGIAGSQKNLRNIEAHAMSMVYALKAERFRVRNNRWPHDFQELLDNQPVPIDPWGQPLRMIASDHGIRIYSLGINGHDDNGWSRWDDDATSDRADDQRFILLNPQERGLIPKPIIKEESNEEIYLGGGYPSYAD